MAHVFAPKDFKIIRDALSVYIRLAHHGNTCEEEMRDVYALYHRLGRVVEKDEQEGRT